VSEATAGFQLDSTLAADSLPVAELALSSLRLMRDANYPWLLLVPRQAGLVELIDLEAADRARLMEEIAAVSTALREATACDKLNVAALGNQVRQLHVHIIARFVSDPAWPGPVWGKMSPVPWETGPRETLIGALRARLT
jgi:diadenosine tetraphosphate (Ap4A) HIT family hydrolase